MRELLADCAKGVYEVEKSERIEMLRSEEHLPELRKLAREAVMSFMQRHPELLHLMLACNENQGLGNNEEEAVEDCVSIVELLVELGACHILTSVDDAISWCLD